MSQSGPLRDTTGRLLTVPLSLPEKVAPMQPLALADLTAADCSARRPSAVEVSELSRSPGAGRSLRDVRR